MLMINDDAHQIDTQLIGLGNLLSVATGSRIGITPHIEIQCTSPSLETPFRRISGVLKGLRKTVSCRSWFQDWGHPIWIQCTIGAQS
ncbi:hypothetical protein CEXT_334061 [Caerostris extrusa]|uniref:Uncharacterized protein n=1 Tax=Caerostris extrusa TaxID=172846 RepID=A0AAV4XWC7_CAEEX|nr:hypothetical protein CEXT_334061 [Caerostris extrusa]